MPEPRRRLHAVLAAALVAVPSSAAAGTPVCSVEAVGTVACMGGRQCRCGVVRGSPATGLPDGFGWDCGIVRPACGPPAPATLDPWQGGLPDSLQLDQSTTIIRQDHGRPRGSAPR